MKICLTGGTGFIGSRVKSFFEHKGFIVENVTRADIRSSVESWKHKLDGAEMLINLAGAPIYKRWTPAYKIEILNSRVETTLKLLEAFKQIENKPSLVLSASAVGIYDEYEIHDEFSDHFGTGFLADVCKQWETSIASIATETTRLAILRIGVVLDSGGGALAKMLPSFKMGMGAVIGSGEQAFPCIHISDFLSAIWFLYQNEESSGIFNMVAPDIVSNKYFSKKLGEVLHRPVFLKVPQSLLKLGLGDGAVVLTKGQKIKPTRLTNSGFSYQFPSVNSILQDILK